METLDIYIIYTGNHFNQILVFETWETAFKWCKAATTWTDDEIKENIRQPWKTGSNTHYTVNPHHNPPLHEI